MGRKSGKQMAVRQHRRRGRRSAPPTEVSSTVLHPHLTVPFLAPPPPSPWSQCFSRSYASVLPTSLKHFNSMSQRLFTSESGCGYRYGRAHKGSRNRRDAEASLYAANDCVWMWISDRAFVRIVKAPRTAQMGRAAFPMCSDAFLHLK